MSVSFRPGRHSTNRAIYGPRVGEPTIESEIDRLYGLPLAEFTKERDALARRLRAEADATTAATIAELRKPVLAAWVVNRLAREQRADVKALVDAAAEIRAGKPRCGRSLSATADELVRAGRETLAGAGRPATDAVVRDVATTLRAAAAAEPPELLLRGRLTEPFEATGFEAMAGAAPGVRRAPPAVSRNRRPVPDRVRVEPARKALAAARDEARTLARGRADRRAGGEPPPRRRGRGREERRRGRGRPREAALASEAEHELALAALPGHMERVPCCDAVASLVDGALASVIGVRVAAAVLALPVLLAVTFLLRSSVPTRGSTGSQDVYPCVSGHARSCEIT